MAALRDAHFTATGTARASAKKVDAAGEEVVPVREVQPPTEARKRETKEALADRIVAVCLTAAEPLTYRALGAALGITHNSSSIKRAVALAIADGRVRLEQGRGFVAVTPVTPVASLGPLTGPAWLPDPAESSLKDDSQGDPQ